MGQKTRLRWSKVDSFLGNSSSKTLAYFRPCPICGSLDSKAILELSNFQFYSDSAVAAKRFDIRQVMCRVCSTLYLNPCYSKYGFSVLFEEAGQSYGSMAVHVDEQIQWLRDQHLLNNGTRLLDVGCYDGRFLAQLPKSVTKLGVDIDESAVERGRQQFKDKNIQFFSGDFETFSFDEEAPQTITMFHVLEHLPNPVEVLRKLRSIAGESTGLVIEVPILENSGTNDINSFFIEQHTTHFSRTSLHNCLTQAGWQIEVQYEVPDYNGYRILARPLNTEDRTILIKSAPGDWADLQSSLATWHNAVGNIESIAQTISRTDRFVIWGAGAHTEHLYQVTSLFHAHPDRKYVLVDSDPLKYGKSWHGIQIYDPSVIEDLDWSSTNLIISSYSSQDTIQKIAVEMNVPRENIIRFYNAVSRY